MVYPLCFGKWIKKTQIYFLKDMVCSWVSCRKAECSKNCTHKKKKKHRIYFQVRLTKFLLLFLTKKTKKKCNSEREKEDGGGESPMGSAVLLYFETKACENPFHITILCAYLFILLPSYWGVHRIHKKKITFILNLGFELMFALKMSNQKKKKKPSITLLRFFDKSLQCSQKINYKVAKERERER